MRNTSCDHVPTTCDCYGSLEIPAHHLIVSSRKGLPSIVITHGSKELVLYSPIASGAFDTHCKATDFYFNICRGAVAAGRVCVCVHRLLCMFRESPKKPSGYFRHFLVSCVFLFCHVYGLLINFIILSFHTSMTQPSP